MYYLLAAVISAIFAGLCLESYKRHRDRQGAASAINGEIFSILHMQEKRQTARNFSMLLPRLDAGEKITIPDITGSFGEALKIDPVIEKHLDRIGLLLENVPERITTFYSYMRGIRIDLIHLSKGIFPEPTAQANIIRADLALWADAEQLGTSLGVDLRRIATEKWWPIAKAESSRTVAVGWFYVTKAKVLRQPAKTIVPPQPNTVDNAPLNEVLARNSPIAPHYQELVAQAETQLNSAISEVMARLGISQENALRFLTVDYLSTLHLERAAKNIFGSQIDAIMFLSANNGRATTEEVRQFYTTASMLHPTVYTNYSFESWLRFYKSGA